jgi:hypothetical protein
LSLASTDPNYGKAQFWKSADGGYSWTALPVDPVTPAAGSEWQNQEIYYWDIVNNTVTFLLRQHDILVDFDLNTETWGPHYGSSTQQIITGNGTRIVRLSDGRIRAFYSYSPDGGTTWEFCWAIAAAGGAWTSINNGMTSVANPANTPACIAACIDSADSAYAVFINASHTAAQYSEVSVTSSNAVSAITTIPGITVGAYPQNAMNLMAGADGQLYFAGILAGTSHRTVDVWIGSSTGWVHETVTDYGTATGAPAPYLSYVTWVDGYATMVWLTIYTPGTHFPNYPDGQNKILVSQRIGVGSWTAPGTYLDLTVTQPPAPLEPYDAWTAPTPGTNWWCWSLSAFPVASLPQGLGLAVALGTIAGDGSYGNMAFIYGPCSPVLKDNYIAMGDALIAARRFIA